MQGRIARLRGAGRALLNAQRARRDASCDVEFDRLNDQTFQALEDCWIALIPHQRQKPTPSPPRTDPPTAGIPHAVTPPHPLRPVWFTACWMFATGKDGISALSLQRSLGIGSYPYGTYQRIFERVLELQDDAGKLDWLMSVDPHTGSEDGVGAPSNVWRPSLRGIAFLLVNHSSGEKRSPTPGVLTGGHGAGPDTSGARTTGLTR